MWTITCSEHDDVRLDFLTEEQAERWLDAHGKTHEYRNCDLWLNHP